MSIVRVRKNKNYFHASNIPFNDKRLSWESRGLMGYLLSKPDGWKVRMEDLKNQTSESKRQAGDYKIKQMLKELKMCGYINRIRVSRDDGTFDWITDVYESPADNPRPNKTFVASVRKSPTGSSGRLSTSGLSTSGKPPDIVITESDNTESFEEEETPPEKTIFAFYEEEIGVITPMISDSIQDWEKSVTEQWIRDAITIASNNNARNWKYINSILTRWEKQGNQEPSINKGRKQAGELPDTSPAAKILGGS